MLPGVNIEISQGPHTKPNTSWHESTHKTKQVMSGLAISTPGP